MDLRRRDLVGMREHCRIIQRPGVAAVGRVYQKPISKYDTTPTASQPKNNCMKLFDITSISIENVNSEI